MRLLAIGNWLFIMRLLAVGYWPVVIYMRLLAIGCWLLAFITSKKPTAKS